MSRFPIRTLNGVGVVATSKRQIKDGFEYDNYFPKPEYSDPLLTPNGANEDTIDVFIPKIVKQYLSDTSKIAEVLKQTTLEATCRAIFDFIYTHIQYHLDSPTEEQIRRPARSWADRKQGVDCDCYTVFISSILTNLDIPHRLRMTSYNHTRGYQHIYVVVPKRNNANMCNKADYWTIDPVLNSFNEEKPYLTKKDKIMTLSNGLSGFPIRGLNGGEPTFKARSKFVYDDIYLIPAANTWGLKGIDGGYYLEGDFARRYVLPLDGVGLGIWGTVISTGLKLGKGLFRGIKGLFKGKKWRRAQRAKREAEAKAQAQAQAQTLTPVNSGFTPQRGQFGLNPQGGGMLQNNSPFNPQGGGFRLAENPFKKEEFFAREDNQTRLLASLFDERTKQSNNSIVRSLDTINSNQKSEIGRLAARLLAVASDSANQGKNLENILADVKNSALTSQATIKEQQSIDSYNLRKLNENIINSQKISISSNMQKVLMVSLIGGALLLLLYQRNNNQQTTINKQQ